MKQSPTVVYSRALLLRWLTTPIKFEYDDQSTCKESPGQIVQGKVVFFVEDADRPPCHRLSCFRGSSFTHIRPIFLIRNSKDHHRFTCYFVYICFYFPLGRPKYEWGYVMMDSYLFFCQCTVTRCWQRSTSAGQFVGGSMATLASLCVPSTARIHRPRMTNHKVARLVCLLLSLIQ